MDSKRFGSKTKLCFAEQIDENGNLKTKICMASIYLLEHPSSLLSSITIVSSHSLYSVVFVLFFYCFISGSSIEDTFYTLEFNYYSLCNAEGTGPLWRISNFRSTCFFKLLIVKIWAFFNQFLTNLYLSKS